MVFALKANIWVLSSFKFLCFENCFKKALLHDSWKIEEKELFLKTTFPCNFKEFIRGNSPFEVKALYLVTWLNWKFFPFQWFLKQFEAVFCEVDICWYRYNILPVLWRYSFTKYGLEEWLGYELWMKSFMSNFFREFCSLDKVSLHLCKKTILI